MDENAQIFLFLFSGIRELLHQSLMHILLCYIFHLDLKKLKIEQEVGAILLLDIGENADSFYFSQKVGSYFIKLLNCSLFRLAPTWDYFLYWQNTRATVILN